MCVCAADIQLSGIKQTDRQTDRHMYGALYLFLPNKVESAKALVVHKRPILKYNRIV